MRFRLPAAIFAGALLLLSAAACSDGRTYDTSKSDDQYDLASMRLQPADIPAGFEETELPSHEFDNENWAQILSSDDPEGKQKQLDAQGRLKNYVTSYSALKLGPVFAITSISTLYSDEKSADAAEKQYACDVPIADGTPLDEFEVPTLGNHSSGFFVNQDRGGGQSFIDTTFCFRTGRILHVVQQTSLPGVEDVALNVRLAQTMLRHVNDTFDGKTAPTEPPSSATEEPTLQPIATPPAGGTATSGGTATGTRPPANATPSPSAAASGTATGPTTTR